MASMAIRPFFTCWDIDVKNDENVDGDDDIGDDDYSGDSNIWRKSMQKSILRKNREVHKTAYHITKHYLSQQTLN